MDLASSALPDDVAALRSLVLAQRDEIVRLEPNNRLLAKLVFGRSSEKAPPPPSPEAALQGHLFAREIAAEAARLAGELGVTATVEIPATRGR